MAPLTMTFNDFECHFCCLKPFYLTYFGKHSMYYLRYVGTWTGKRTWLVVSTVFLQIKDFSRSQPVTYTVNVEISRKQCQRESLLRTTNRNKEVIYGLSNRSNSDDLGSPSRSFLLQAFEIWFFVQLYSIWHNALRGPSAIAELLVALLDKCAKYCNQRACVWMPVCLSVRSHISKTTKFHNIFCTY